MTIMVLIMNLITKLLLWAGQRDVLCVSPDQESVVPALRAGTVLCVAQINPPPTHP